MANRNWRYWADQICTTLYRDGDITSERGGATAILFERLGAEGTGLSVTRRSAVLNLIEERGYIERLVSGKTSVFIALTEKGRQLAWRYARFLEMPYIERSSGQPCPICVDGKDYVSLATHLRGLHDVKPVVGGRSQKPPERLVEVLKDHPSARIPDVAPVPLDGADAAASEAEAGRIADALLQRVLEVLAAAKQQPKAQAEADELRKQTRVARERADSLASKLALAESNNTTLLERIREQEHQLAAKDRRIKALEDGRRTRGRSLGEMLSPEAKAELDRIANGQA